MPTAQHIPHVVEGLARNQGVFRELLSATAPGQILWRPAPEKWNLLEITCHLGDEERLDFRARVRHVLETPQEPMPPIDPLAWVKDKKYGEQDFDERVQDFLDERSRSLHWLESLQQPRWEQTYLHPKMGPVSAAFLMANWLAHDYLHIRQITRLRYQYLAFLSGEKLDYAGTW
jgi:hypothetical protein